MKCPECVKECQKSCVQEGIRTSTLLGCPPFYDEEGVYHIHDSNLKTQFFQCDRGHTWAKQSLPKCPNCDWPNKD